MMQTSPKDSALQEFIKELDKRGDTYELGRTVARYRTDVIWHHSLGKTIVHFQHTNQEHKLLHDKVSKWYKKGYYQLWIVPWRKEMTRNLENYRPNECERWIQSCYRGRAFYWGGGKIWSVHFDSIDKNHKRDICLVHPEHVDLSELDFYKRKDYTKPPYTAPEAILLQDHKRCNFWGDTLKEIFAKEAEDLEEGFDEGGDFDDEEEFDDFEEETFEPPRPKRSNGNGTKDYNDSMHPETLALLLKQQDYELAMVLKKLMENYQQEVNKVLDAYVQRRIPDLQNRKTNTTFL